jgi:hypothetical protein
MFQNTGRVCSRYDKDNHALRSSLFVYAADMVLLLIKFGCMLVVRCRLRVAAKHVWYDRFVKDEKIQSPDTLEMWKI